MKKNNSNQESRSLFVTLLATIIGLLSLAVSLLMLPIDGVMELGAFIIGILITLTSTLAAIDGKVESIKTVIHSLYHWT